jgi:hypothetical protein
MSRNAADVVPDGQSQRATPSGGNPEGSDLHSIARQVEGLLDDDGQFNPNPDQLSRGHPDYDESKDDRASSDRDTKGRFTKRDDDGLAADTEITGDGDDDETQDIPTGEDQDEDTRPGDTDDDLAASASDDAQTDDTETGDIRTLQEFADALEIPLEDMKAAVTHSFNAAGEDVTVTLAELESGYQKDADYRRNTAKLSEDRQIAEAELMQRRNDYEQQNYFLAGSMQIAENIVASELNDPRLTDLRESDPAEWTARRDEIGQRLQGLRNSRIQAAQAYDQYTNTMKAQLRDREIGALAQALPDFGPKDRATVKTLLGEMGYSSYEVSEIFDHRMVMGALELANARTELTELRALKKQAEDTTRRVKKDIPKLSKPGKQRRKGAGIKRDNLTRLRQRAQKSGSIDDAAKVIEQLI